MEKTGLVILLEAVQENDISAIGAKALTA